MKKAIVVGLSSGIGRQLAIILAENGYKVGIKPARPAFTKPPGYKAGGSTSNN
jgi:NAD(P)-dependent dehydrogenase (short-subunit alcohol dehydrogenase family)